MRRYEITDAAGNVLRTVEEDDTMRPALLAGESLRPTHVDGEPAIKGEPVQLTNADRENLPSLLPPGDAPAELGFTMAEHQPEPGSHAEHE